MLSKSTMKEIARMNFDERLLVLRRDANKPEQIKTADRILEAMLQEMQIVRAVRNDAALRYGVKLPPLADLSPAPDTQPPAKNERTGFDGTLAGLLDRYLTNPESPFVNLRFHTRKYYTICCKRLQKEHGTEVVDQIGMTTFEDWHRRWTVANGSSMAKALITILRLVFSFGATRLQFALHTHIPHSEQNEIQNHKVACGKAKPRSGPIDLRRSASPAVSFDCFGSDTSV